MLCEVDDPLGGGQLRLDLTQESGAGGHPEPTFNPSIETTKGATRVELDDPVVNGEKPPCMADPLADHDTVRIFPHWEGGIVRQGRAIKLKPRPARNRFGTDQELTRSHIRPTDGAWASSDVGLRAGLLADGVVLRLRGGG